MERLTVFDSLLRVALADRRISWSERRVLEDLGRALGMPDAKVQERIAWHFVPAPAEPPADKNRESESNAAETSRVGAHSPTESAHAESTSAEWYDATPVGPPPFDVCRVCTAAVPIDARFCPYCGAVLFPSEPDAVGG